MPPLEAMACGTPVVCSSTSSLPEVAGDAALLVPSTDVRALREAMERVLVDEHLRAGLRAKGLEKAKQFTWDRTARQVLAVYEQVMQLRSDKWPLLPGWSRWKCRNVG